MKAITVTHKDSDSQLFEATIHFNDKLFPLFFHAKGSTIRENSETLVSATLLTAMKFNTGSIIVDNQPSSLFLQNLDKIQTIYKSWKPGFQTVRIKSSQPALPVKPSGNRVGLFFSAGVDAFYSLFKHQDQITDVIFVHGFDLPLEVQELRRIRSEAIQRTASSLGIGVVEIETNLRNFMEPGVFWGFGHGAALASAGHLLSGEFKRIYIASGRPLDNLIPWGSHPHLDPLWSNELIEFIHDGAEATRPQKVLYISQQPAVHQNLHVCLHNLPNGLNCGRCEKCVRTMISLRAAGTLDKCQTFERPLTDWTIYRSYLFKAYMRHQVRYNLELSEQVGYDPKLTKILRRIVQSPAIPGWRKIRSKLGWKQPGKIVIKE